MPAETLIPLVLVAIGAPLLWLTALLITIHLVHRLCGRPVIWIGLRWLVSVPVVTVQAVISALEAGVAAVTGGLARAWTWCAARPRAVYEALLIAPDYLMLLTADLWQILRGRPAESRDDDGPDHEPGPVPAAMTFETATARLGLPPAFTHAMFKQAYHAAMKRAHPDLGGSVAAAQAVSEAAMIIRARKGWS